MGGSSSSKQAQTSQSDNSVRSVETGASATVASASNVGGSVTLNQTTTGIDGGTLGDILAGVGEAAREILTQQNTKDAATTKAIADIAQSATASQTEVGKIINQLALPIIILIGVVLLLPSLVKGKK